MSAFRIKGAFGLLFPALLCLGLLALAPALGSPAPAVGSPTPAEAPKEREAAGNHETGDRGPAPSFVLQDLQGRLVESSYASRPVTVVHFWASWCIPCMREIPDLNRYAAAWEADGAALYAVAISSGSQGELRQIARTYDIRHTVLMGDEALVRGFGGISGYPATFIVDSRGRVIEAHIGTTPAIRSKVDETVRAILAASRRSAPPR